MNAAFGLALKRIPRNAARTPTSSQNFEQFGVKVEYMDRLGGSLTGEDLETV